jgi:hypothetical protein
MLQMAFLSIAATGIKEAKIRAKLSRSHTGQGPCARQSVRLRAACCGGARYFGAHPTIRLRLAACDI